MDFERQHEELDKLWRMSTFTPLRIHINALRRCLNLQDMTKRDVLRARQPERIRIYDKRLTGHAVTAMLKLDELTEELLRSLPDHDEDSWGFEWEGNGVVLKGSDGEDVRERIRNGMLTARGSLKTKVNMVRRIAPPF